MNTIQQHSIKVLLASLCVLSLFVLGFHSTFLTLYERWIKWDEAYGHGFLVVAICGYLALRAMSQIRYVSTQPCKSGITVLLCISVLWFIASTAGITIIQQLLLPFALWVLVLVLLGYKAAWTMLFPIGFLYFAIPGWDYLNDLLIHMTVFVVKFLLRLMEIPAFVEGNSIQLPSGRIYVAGGCSGLRYVISGCALASLSAYLNFHQNNRRFMLMALGLLLSIVANWIRVFSLILIGYYTQMESSLMKDHDNFGWVVFFLVFSPVFLLGWYFGQSAQGQSDLTKKERRTNPGGQSKWLLASAALAVLMVGPVLSALSAAGGEPEFRLVFQTPETWERKPLTVEDWMPTLPKPYRQLSAVFEQKGDALTLNIFAYKTEVHSRKLLPYIASIYDRDFWHMDRREITDIPTKTSVIPVNVTEIKRSTGDERAVVWYWYAVGGVNTPHYSMAKMAQVPAKLFQKDYAMVVVLSHSCQQNCEKEHEIIRHFMKSADLSSFNLVVKAENTPGLPAQSEGGSSRQQEWDAL